MYCPNCGAYNEASYNNCTSCGTYIKDINKTCVKAEEKQAFSDDKLDKTSDFISDYENKDREKSEKTKDREFGHSQGEENCGKKEGRFYTVYTKPPKDYLVMSIICTILASMSFGLAAMVFSVMTKVSYSSGKTDTAIKYSNNAKCFCFISVIVGIVKYLFIFIMFGYVFNTMFRDPLYMW